jgi:hypothetical protein
MADVFISYKREDRRVAERLSIALEQLGFDVWWDFEILSGQQFRRVIEKVIDECAAVVVLWSQLSRESRFVVDEATHARELNKLCPARIDDCRPPLGFGGEHIVDLCAWDGELDHEGLKNLVRALETATGKKARLGARARDRDEAARYAEMEAFKAAQASENVGALRAFLNSYPKGAFANFVRAQLEELGARAPAVATARAQGASVAPPPSREVPSYIAPSHRHPPTPPPVHEGPKRRIPWTLVVGLLIVAGVVVLRPWEQRPLQPEQETHSAAPAPSNTNAELEDARRRGREAVERSEPGQASREEAAPSQPVLRRQLPDATARHAPYSLDLLHPRVRAAVLEAREAESRANNAAERARIVAAQAEQSGTRRPRSGYGIQTWGDGDRYAGQFTDRAKSGAGVYTHGSTDRSLRFEGEFAADQVNGFGVYYWRDGERYAGDYRSNVRIGYGVQSFADGSRYEGQWASDARNGHGVLWDANGRVIQQGLWTNARLTTPLSP